MITVNGDKKQYAIGVDIGGTKILFLAANKYGKVIHKKKVNSTGDLYKICQLIDTFIEEACISKEEILGMGIGVPGEVNSSTGVVRLSIQMGWKDMNVKEYISQRYDFPIFVKNDLNFSDIGERWVGNGNNSDKIVYISIGTGVGGAIIANGHLIEGHNYSAGEFGYIIDGEDMKTGIFNETEDFGSLERKVSGYALSGKANKIGFSCEELFREYMKSNRLAAEVIDKFISELSIVIANLVSILNPEYVIIGGGVSESMGEIRGYISENVKKLTIFPVEIKLSKLGGEAGAFGCIYYVLHEAFSQVEDIHQV